MHFFFFNDTEPPEISTLPLPDALPISEVGEGAVGLDPREVGSDRPQDRRGRDARQCGEAREREPPAEAARPRDGERDRKSTRLNSSHAHISYAVFCLKKKRRPAAYDTP